METSCKNYFMSGEIKELKKPKKTYNAFFMIVERVNPQKTCLATSF